MSSTCVAQNTDGNLGLAFGLVTAAGLSTCIGAAISFVMPRNKNLFLAAALAIAAGVMLFVSFTEIFSDKAVTSIAACVFDSEGNPDECANIISETK